MADDKNKDESPAEDKKRPATGHDASKDDNVDEIAHLMGEPFEDVPEPAPVVAIRKVDQAIGVVEQIAVAAFFATLIGVAAYKGICSQFFDINLVWTGPFIWHMLFLVGVAAAALSIQTQQIIKMDFVTRKVRVGIRLTLRIIANTFAVIVLGLVVNQAWESRVVFEVTDELLDPRLVAISLPVAGGLIALHFCLHIIIDGIYLSRGEAPPEAEMSGH